MFSFIKQKKSNPMHKILCSFIAFTFTFSSVTPPGYAQFAPQTVLNLPAPGTMLPLSPAFTPTIVRGMTIHPENPLQFDFIIDNGDTSLKGEAFKDESTKLIKYFLAALTVADKEQWVNLSPYEGDRIVPQDFGETELGRDLLAQDYLLKQLTASLMYPEDELGGKFWDRVYALAFEKFGTTDIPMNTFNKVWIVPQKAVVYEHENSAFVLESHLKVLLEEDYLALEQNRDNTWFGMNSLVKNDVKVISGISSQIVREVLIPEIEKEVNTGETFANLRQIYNSMILASWYKDNLKESLLGQVYVNRNKTMGVDIADKQSKQKIYDQYVKAFKKGVYDYIREDYDPATQTTIPRKYFSGGARFGDALTENITVVRGDPNDVIGSSPLESDDQTRVTWAAIENADENTPSAAIQVPASSPIQSNMFSGVAEQTTIEERTREVEAERRRLRFEEGRFTKLFQTARQTAALQEPIQNRYNISAFTGRNFWRDLLGHFRNGTTIATYGQTNNVMAEATARSKVIAHVEVTDQMVREIIGLDASREQAADFKADLVENGYVNVETGLTTDKFIELTSPAEMKLNGDYGIHISLIYLRLQKNVWLHIQGYYNGGWAAIMKLGATDQARAEYQYLVQQAIEMTRMLLSHARAQEAAISLMNLSEEEDRDFRRSKDFVNFYLPIFMDIDEGHLKPQQLIEVDLTVQGGVLVAAVHLEDQCHGAKKCGHMSGKALETTKDYIQMLNMVKAELERLGLSDVLVVGRTDAEAAEWISGIDDGRDQRFLLGVSGEITEDIIQALLTKAEGQIRDRVKKQVTENKIKPTDAEKLIRESMASMESMVRDNMIDENRRLIAYNDVITFAREVKKLEGADLQVVHRAWKELAQLKTVDVVVEDIIREREGTVDALDMNLKEWREFVQSIPFEYSGNFIGRVKEKAEELGIIIHSLDEYRRTKRLYSENLNDGRTHVIWDTEATQMHDETRHYWMIKSGIPMAIARNMAAQATIDVAWMEQHRANVLEVMIWAMALDQAAVDLLIKENYWDLLNDEPYGDTFKGKHRKDIESILRIYLVERRKNPSKAFETARDDLVSLGIEMETGLQLINAVSRIKANNTSPSFGWPLAKVGMTKDELEEIFDDIDKFLPSFEHAGLNAEELAEEPRLMTDEERKSFLKDQGVDVQFQFSTYFGELLNHVMTQLFNEGIEGRGRVTEAKIREILSDIYENGYLRDGMFTVSKIQELGYIINNVFTDNTQIFAGMVFDSLRQAWAKGEATLLDAMRGSGSTQTDSLGEEYDSTSQETPFSVEKVTTDRTKRLISTLELALSRTLNVEELKVVIVEAHAELDTVRTRISEGVGEFSEDEKELEILVNKIIDKLMGIEGADKVSFNFGEISWDHAELRIDLHKRFYTDGPQIGLTRELFMLRASERGLTRRETARKRRVAELISKAEEQLDRLSGGDEASSPVLLSRTGRAVHKAMLNDPTRFFLADDGTSKTIDKAIAGFALGITLEEYYAMFPTEEQRVENRRLARVLSHTAKVIRYTLSAIIEQSATAEFQHDEQTLADIAIAMGVGLNHKADLSTEPLADNPLEVVLKSIILGDENLARHLAAFPNSTSTKTRVPITIDKATGTPHTEYLRRVARDYAQHAKEVLATDRNPVLEPEIMLEGTHDIETHFKVAEQLYTMIIEEILKLGLDTREIDFKIAYVQPGKNGPKVSNEEVAKRTVDLVEEVFATHGIDLFFLSGGLTSEDALDKMNETAREGSRRGVAVNLTISFSRALLGPLYAVWKLKAENFDAAQEAFNILLLRAQASILGVLAQFDMMLERVGAKTLLADDVLEDYQDMIVNEVAMSRLSERESSVAEFSAVFSPVIDAERVERIVRGAIAEELGIEPGEVVLDESFSTVVPSAGERLDIITAIETKLNVIPATQVQSSRFNHNPIRRIVEHFAGAKKKSDPPTTTEVDPTVGSSEFDGINGPGAGGTSSPIQAADFITKAANDPAPKNRDLVEQLGDVLEGLYHGNKVRNTNGWSDVVLFDAAVEGENIRFEDSIERIRNDEGIAKAQAGRVNLEEIKARREGRDVREVASIADAKIRNLKLLHKHGFKTKSGAPAWVTRVDARSATVTYNRQDERYTSEKTVPQKSASSENAPDEEMVLAAILEHLKTRELLQLDVTLGEDPSESPHGRLLIDSNYGRNVMMAKRLLALRENGAQVTPDLTVITLPDLNLKDLGIENAGSAYVLRIASMNLQFVIGTDYFGENKKAFLALLGIVERAKGNIMAHAGSFTTWARNAAGELIQKFWIAFGLSGTGKTSTVAQDHGLTEDDERAVMNQDDMVIAVPQWEGEPRKSKILGVVKVRGSELGGSYVKSEGVTAKSEPRIYEGLMNDPDSILENIAMVEEDGELVPDLLNYDMTRNGRAILTRKAMVGEDNAGVSIDMGGLDNIMMLTRGGLAPAVALPDTARGAGKLALGETVVTSAGSPDPSKWGPKREPVFTVFDATHQGMSIEVLRQIVEATDARFIVSNTGTVGYQEDNDGNVINPGIDVSLKMSGAVIRALARDSAEFSEHPLLGERVISGGVTDLDGEPIDMSQYLPDQYFGDRFKSALAQQEEARLAFLQDFDRRLRDWHLDRSIYDAFSTASSPVVGEMKGDPDQVGIVQVREKGDSVDMSRFTIVQDSRFAPLVAHMMETFFAGHTGIMNRRVERLAAIDRKDHVPGKDDIRPDEVIPDPYDNTATVREILTTKEKARPISKLLAKAGAILTGNWELPMAQSALRGRVITTEDRALYNDVLDKLQGELPESFVQALDTVQLRKPGGELASLEDKKAYIQSKLKTVQGELAHTQKTVPVRLFTDFQDASKLHGGGVLEMAQNVSDILNGRITSVTKRTADGSTEERPMPPRDEWPVITLRVADMEMFSNHITYKGQPVPEIITTLIYAIMMDSDKLEALVYPKLESPEELAYVLRMKNEIQAQLAIKRHIHGILMNETIESAILLKVMAWVGRFDIDLINVGRWDKGAADMRMFMIWLKKVFGDLSKVGMFLRHMDTYVRQNIATAVGFGMKGEGGMRVGMPSEGYHDATVDRKVITGIVLDVLYEWLLGYDYGWVATPSYTPLVQALYQMTRELEPVIEERPYDQDLLDDLLAFPEVPLTRGELKQEIYEQLTYQGGARNTGLAIAIDSRTDGGRSMFDGATSLKINNKLWPAVRFGARITEGPDAGRVIDMDLIRELTDEVIAETMDRYRVFWGADTENEVAIARMLLEATVTTRYPIWYVKQLMNHVINVRDPRIARRKIVEWVQEHNDRMVGIFDGDITLPAASSPVVQRLSHEDMVVMGQSPEGKDELRALLASARAAIARLQSSETTNTADLGAWSSYAAEINEILRGSEQSGDTDAASSPVVTFEHDVNEEKIGYRFDSVEGAEDISQLIATYRDSPRLVLDWAISKEFIADFTEAHDDDAGASKLLERAIVIASRYMSLGIRNPFIHKDRRAFITHLLEVSYHFVRLGISDKRAVLAALFHHVLYTVDKSQWDDTLGQIFKELNTDDEGAEDTVITRAEFDAIKIILTQRMPPKEDLPESVFRPFMTRDGEVLTARGEQAADFDHLTIIANVPGSSTRFDQMDPEKAKALFKGMSEEERLIVKTGMRIKVTGFLQDLHVNESSYTVDSYRYILQQVTIDRMREFLKIPDVFPEALSKEFNKFLNLHEKRRQEREFILEKLGQFSGNGLILDKAEETGTVRELGLFDGGLEINFLNLEPMLEAIEDELEINITRNKDVDLDAIQTVGDVLDVVDKLSRAKDSAAVDEDPETASSPLGGINLDSALLDLQIKRDGRGVPLPIGQQPIGDMKINGFFPVIINITPVNLPLLLGVVSDEEKDSSDVSYRSLDPMDQKGRFEFGEKEENQTS